jgi:RNA polymerase sigma-70 factor (ECF subfamily)
MAKHDPEAFGQIYDIYFPRIYSYIYRRVGDRSLAEDLTSDTFFRALKAIKTFEWRGMPFSAWLYRIAGNTVTDHFRSLRESVPLEDQWGLQDQAEGPEAAALRSDRAEEVLRAVKTLSPDQQDVVLLRFQGDLRLKEIADIVGKSEGAVKALMFRALHTLRGRLKGEVYP